MRIFSGVIIVALVLMLLVGAVRIIGESTKTANADILASGSHKGSKGWCWHNVCVGETRYADAVTSFKGQHIEILDPDDLTGQKRSGDIWQVEMIKDPDSWANDDHTIASMYIFPPRNTLKLGDLLRLYGNPTAIYLCGYSDYDGNGPAVVGSIAFTDNIQVAVHRRGPLDNVRTTPNMFVDNIYIGPSGNDFREPKQWKGFIAYPEVCGEG